MVGWRAPTAAPAPAAAGGGRGGTGPPPPGPDRCGGQQCRTDRHPANVLVQNGQHVPEREPTAPDLDREQRVVDVAGGGGRHQGLRLHDRWQSDYEHAGTRGPMVVSAVHDG